MPSTREIKVTIGGPEVTPGVPVALTHVIPISDVPDLDKLSERENDPAIIGTNMDAGDYPMAENVSGALPLAPRACPGFGKLLKSCLGKSFAPDQIDAAIRIRYVGVSNSAKIEIDGTENQIKSSIGEKGAEVADANFKSDVADGIIDCDDAAADSLSELVALVNGLTDYNCEKLFGDDALALTTGNGQVVEIDATVNTFQGKNRWIYVFFASTTSGVYVQLLQFLSTTAELPTYTTQKDFITDNFLYDGYNSSQITLSAALKGMMSGTANGLGFKETKGQTASLLTLEDRDPFIFWKGSFSVDEDEFPYIRETNIDMNHNANEDGFGQGLVTRQYQQKGKFTATGSFSVRLDNDSYELRDKVHTGAQAGISWYFKGTKIDANHDEMMIVALPYCQITAFEFLDNNGILDGTINYKAIYPKGNIYENPVNIYIISQDSAEY